MNQERSHLKSGGHTCPWWLIFTFDNPLRKLIHNPEKILGVYVGRGDTVLDVGCGMGFFSIGLAKLVGGTGTVIAADLQLEMLAGLRKRAGQTGLADRIRIQQSTPEQIGVNEPVDFALAFWMVHEVHDQGSFLRQIQAQLKPGGKFLVAEPRIHVSGKAFERMINLAQTIGLQVADRPRVAASRAVLLEN